MRMQGGRRRQRRQGRAQKGRGDIFKGEERAEGVSGLHGLLTRHGTLEEQWLDGGESSSC